jgi:beta-N-acetylhexosaminidase
MGQGLLGAATKTVCCTVICSLFFFTPYWIAIPQDTGGGRALNHPYSLEDFYSENRELDFLVNRIMGTLSSQEMISQMIVASSTNNQGSYRKVLRLVREGKTGGVMFIGVTTDEIRQYIREFNEASAVNSPLLPLYSIDGEPVLIHERITDLEPIQGARELRTVRETREIATQIMILVRDLGIHVNYAPVCDLSLNREVIRNRSFGREPERVSELANIFIEIMQAGGVVATAKHFPGHGTAEGDSHEGLVFVDGDPPEISIFTDAIKGGVISVMVGHIAVINSPVYGTQGMPATLSVKSIRDVLKNRLGFRGIVVTDALNMGGVQFFDFPALLAVKAGSDMVLMPENELSFIESVEREMQLNDQFRLQINESVQKIIKLKVCLGLINNKKPVKSGEFDDIF